MSRHLDIIESLLRAGDLASAIPKLHEYLQHHPDDAQQWGNLGLAYYLSRDFDNAVTFLKKASELTPTDHELRRKLGASLCEQGRHRAALSCFNKIIAELEGANLNEIQRRTLADSYFNCAISYNKSHKEELCKQMYLKSLEIDERQFNVHNNLGTLYHHDNNYRQALHHFNRANELEPSHASTLNNVAIIKQALMQSDDARRYYEKALACDPDSPKLYSGLLLMLTRLENLAKNEIFELSQRFNRAAMQQVTLQPLPPSTPALAPRRTESNDGSLRIGFISPDFRQHSVAYFLTPFFQFLPACNIEIYCYYCDNKEDEITSYLADIATCFRRVHNNNGYEIAQIARGDQLDIAIDLAGHTGKSCIDAFAYRLAPIQCSWLGYPHTTGLETMDYRLVDGYSDPLSNEDRYSEQLMRMPNHFLCYQAPTSLIDIEWQGAQMIRFGSLNNSEKISQSSIELWSAILSAVPDSTLTLKSTQTSTPEVIDWIKEQFARRDIDSQRIICLPYAHSLGDHLRCYNAIDIALDTFPYHGTTTTFEALFMGVPVISLAGKTHASRVGVSILTGMGLQDLCAQNREEYISCAGALAADQERLAQLRHSLRQRLLESPLCDAPRFAREFAQTLRALS